MLRRGLTALIDSEHDVVVCAGAATAREALDAIGAGLDLVIADFSFDDGLGLDLVREIRARHPPLPVLLMSVDGSAFYGERAREAGASGCVGKQELDETVLTAVRAVLDSRTDFSGRLGPGRLGS